MSVRLRRSIPLMSLPAAVLVLFLSAQSVADAAGPDAQKTPGPVAAADSAPPVVQSFAKAEEAKYPWGWIRWLMSAKIDPGAEMTFGIVYVKPHQENPAHVHPNCAEVLHVLEGSCEHLVGDKWVALKAGDTIRIPVGVPHRARTLDQPMRAIVVYNTGDRQFQPVEEEK
jgi:quercetin dioxygenase-like cupin family protein